MNRSTLLYEFSELFRMGSKAWAHHWTHNNPDGITITEAALLDTLARNGAMQPSSLATALLITTGGVTGVADKLVERGWIARSRDDHDRRVVYLTITDLGRTTHQAMSKRREEQLEQALSVLTDGEVETLVSIYRKLIGGITHTDH